MGTEVVDDGNMKGLDTFEGVLHAMAISMHREQLVYALAPIWATAEQKAEAKAKVDALSDEKIDEMMTAWIEEVSKYCPECGQLYEVEPGPMPEACVFS